MSDEPRVPTASEPDPPSADDVETMRRHVVEVHGREFDLHRDVSFAGNATASAALTYVAPTSARGAAFNCRECPGKKMLLSDPMAGSAERHEHLRLRDPQLKPWLAATPPEYHDTIIELYEERLLGPLLAPPPRGTVAEDTRRVDGAPERTRETTKQLARRCQGFLLRRRLAGRTVDEAVDDLRDLRETNRRLYRQVIGSDREYSPERLRDFYKQLPPAIKKRAAEHCRALRADGRAKPKYGKFTG